MVDTWTVTSQTGSWGTAPPSTFVLITESDQPLETEALLEIGVPTINTDWTVQSVNTTNWSVI